MVDTIVTFRNRYAIEAKSLDHAYDTIVMNEAGEFSQMFLGEQIVTGREVTYDEYDAMNASLEGVGDGTVYQPESGSPWMGRKSIHKVDYDDDKVDNKSV
jgi:hypothetical protein